MPFELPALPYEKNALAPAISAETLEFHYGKHHQRYVTVLNDLTKDSPHATKSLEQLMQERPTPGIFNNAAQIWNHTFYWHSLSPKGGGQPTGKLADAIKASFGSFEDFQKQFTQVATTHFGSGWAWLVKKADGKLAVAQSHDAECPLTSGDKPLLTCDVWEHAYYIDYRNNRAGYVESWWKLVNWDFATKNLG
ncbi:MAG: superoxide dismutase [Fe] [Planctomycetes bacterium]|nr:superoxide dismutase [Fe] [Planctomycetota bacterium]